MELISKTASLPWKPALRKGLAFLRPRSPEGRLTTYSDRYWIAAALSWLWLPVPFLLSLFGSDKQRPDEHAYGETYASIIARYRHRRTRLLEIGILSGDSLLSWRATFPLGTIVGCDIEPKNHMGIGRIHVHLTDQSSAIDLNKLVQQEGPFDIIIDDGSHQSAHQIFSFRQLFPHLRDGGVYIIEDVQTSYWPAFAGGKHVSDPAFAGTCVGEFLELAKYINHAEFWSTDGVDQDRVAIAEQIQRIVFEHNLIVIWKGPNTLPSNWLHRMKPTAAPS